MDDIYPLLSLSDGNAQTSCTTTETLTGNMHNLKASLARDVQAVLVRLYDHRATKPGDWFSRNLVSIAYCEYESTFILSTTEHVTKCRRNIWNLT